jgi:hypothetical protein
MTELRIEAVAFPWLCQFSWLPISKCVFAAYRFVYRLMFWLAGRGVSAGRDLLMDNLFVSSVALVVLTCQHSMSADLDFGSIAARHYREMIGAGL